MSSSLGVTETVILGAPEPCSSLFLLYQPPHKAFGTPSSLAYRYTVCAVAHPHEDTIVSNELPLFVVYGISLPSSTASLDI